MQPVAAKAAEAQHAWRQHALGLRPAPTPVRSSRRVLELSPAAAAAGVCWRPICSGRRRALGRCRALASRYGRPAATRGATLLQDNHLHQGSECLNDWVTLERVFYEATGGEETIGLHDFVGLCTGVLHVGLSEGELKRVYDVIVPEGAPGLTAGTFCQAVCNRFFLRQVFRIRRRRPGSKVPSLPKGYDLDADTASNYSDPLEDFQGPFAEIRATRDESYHGRYSRERQMWQDEVLEPVVQRTAAQPMPWLVFTCGAMGVGKGYTLGWMSSQGIFPLENIVHIDPDHFKKVMPEWDAYVEHGRRLGDPTIPGSRCHKESSYMQELALEESLRRSQNIWVDGSLRNAEWFIHVFEDIRDRYPMYRIAIFQVTASEQQIRQRVARRAVLTQRAVPERVLQDSIEAVERSVSLLQPHADFMASIDNTERVPHLTYFASIDRSRSWAPIQSRFAHTVPALAEFPASLAPLFVERVPRVCLRLLEPLRTVVDGCRGAQRAVLTVGKAKYLVMTSPAAPQTLDGELKSLARVPSGSANFVYVYPAGAYQAGAIPGLTGAEHSLLTLGGFAHFDVDEGPMAINAVSLSRPRGPPAGLEFGAAKQMSADEAAALPQQRWAPVTLALMRARGAQRFAFITPQEKLAGRRISSSGGFAYELQEGGQQHRYVYFPVCNVLK